MFDGILHGHAVQDLAQPQVVSKEVGSRNQSSIYCMITVLPMPLRW